MSYQVLARKWRPQNFAQLVGQEHVVAAITNALENNRLHHAYLFTGTRGVGKTTIARIFSKSLNCETGMTATPCGQCATCQDIDQGSFIDLLEIDAASRTKVEDTRDILDNVQYKPTRGRYKVYLIDEVHMLSKHSFNALLKTLEEPPPHVKFLLATTDPQKLPVTILSRCLQFNLKAMSREQIVGQLGHVLQQEQLQFEPDALAQLARAANGSMRDALSLTDQAIAQGNGHVSLQVVTDMLGLMDKNQVLKLLSAVLQQDANEVFAQIEQLAMQAADFSQVLAEIQSLLHQIALTQVVPDACKLETIAARQIYQLAKTISAEHIQLLYQIALQGRKDIPFALDPRSGFEMAILRMLAFAPGKLRMTPAQLTASYQSAAAVEDDLTQQQAHILEQAEQMREEPLGDDLQPEVLTAQATPEDVAEIESESSADMQNESASDLGETNQQQEQIRATSHSENNDDSQVSASPAANTNALLQLRQALKQQAEQDNSAVKKPHADDLTTSLSQSMSQLMQQRAASQSTESEVIETSAVTTAQPIDNEPPPWDDATIPDDNQDVAPMADFEFDANMQDEPAQAVSAPSQPEQQEQDDAQVEADMLGVVVDIEIPASTNGHKVVHAAQIDTWSRIVKESGVMGLSKQLAIHSSMRRVPDGCELVLLQSQQHLINPNTQGQLQQALSQLWQKPVTVNIQLGEPKNTPFAIQQAVNKMRHQEAIKTIQQDAGVQLLQQTFAAEVDTQSIRAVNE